MPIDVTIFPKHGLVHVRYRGVISTEETARAYDQYLDHPDFAPTQHRLFDLSEVTEFRPDHVASLKLHAQMIEEVMRLRHPIMMVYLAPSPAARDVCRGRIESWEPIDRAIACLVDSEEAALEVLGLSARSLGQLYAAVL